MFEVIAWLIILFIFLMLFMFFATIVMATFALIGNFMRWLWEMCVNVFRPRKTR